MLDEIKCTCAKAIGEVLPIYEIMAAKIKEAQPSKAAPDRRQRDPAWKVELGTLLDLLHLRRECCRMHVLSSVRSSEL